MEDGGTGTTTTTTTINVHFFFFRGEREREKRVYLISRERRVLSIFGVPARTEDEERERDTVS